jgi:hypothetical protein
MPNNPTKYKTELIEAKKIKKIKKKLSWVKKRLMFLLNHEANKFIDVKK